MIHVFFPRKKARNGGCSGGRCIYQGIYTLHPVLDCRAHRCLVILEPGSSFRLVSTLQRPGLPAMVFGLPVVPDVIIRIQVSCFEGEAVFTPCTFHPRPFAKCASLCVSFNFAPGPFFGVWCLPVWRFSVLKLWII